MKVKIIAAFVLVFFFGCSGGKDVEFVKNSLLPLDKSITIGNAFESYENVMSYKWKSYQKNNRRFVVFNGSEKAINIHNDIVAYLTNVDDMLNKVSKMLDELWVVAEAIPRSQLESIRDMAKTVPKVLNNYKNNLNKVDEFQLEVIFLINLDNSIEVVSTSGTFTYIDGTANKFQLDENGVLERLYFNKMPIKDILVNHSNIDLQKWDTSEQYFK